MILKLLCFILLFNIVKSLIILIFSNVIVKKENNYFLDINFVEKIIK